MSLGLGVFTAVFFSVLPMVVFALLRSRAERPAWWLAIDLPGAIGLDLTATVLVSRFITLDRAVWVVKGAWLVLGAAIFVFRRSRGWRPSWPRELTRSAVAQALLLGAIALAFSLLMTRPCAIWDRQWHIPSLTSMRGQVSPFMAVYEPWKQIHYHIGGNLMAATLQATSFSTLHASHGLSLVHDICSFWFAVALTFVLQRLGLKHTTLLVLTLLLVLFASPVVPLEGEHRTWFGGYSMTNWMSFSFRPHMTLAMLLLLPFIAVPLIRLTSLAEPIDWRELVLPLMVAIPVLLIADEFGVGIIGMALAGLWLRFPRVFAETRRGGVFFFVGLGVALVVGIAMMQGTISPGAPSYPLQIVFPRSPGYYTAPLRLDTLDGMRYFVSDLLPVLAVLFGGVWLLVRTRHPLLVGTLITYAIVVVVSVTFFLTFSYLGSGLQNHKFVIMPMVFCPLILVAWLIPRTGMHLSYAGVPEVCMALAVFMGAASGVDWLGGLANKDCRSGEVSLDYYGTNCRTDVGATTISEPTRTMYFDPAIQYLYIGCRPAYMAGPAHSMDGHDVKAGTAMAGIGALREITRETRFKPYEADTLVACASGATSDRACRLLKKTPGACRPSGREVELCTLTPDLRNQVFQ